MIKHVKVTSENLKLALKTEALIFGEDSAKMVYTMAINGETSNQYFLLYDGDEIIGVSGIYQNGADNENAWLSYFGILPEKRRNSYGSTALRLLEETARDLGYRYMRAIVKRTESDEDCIKFLIVNGFTGEPYDTPKDRVSQSGNYQIYSRSFYQEKVPLWNNKNLHLDEFQANQKQFK